MSHACPNCRAPLLNLLQKECGSCGHALPLAGQTKGGLGTPRLVGRVADGPFSEFRLLETNTLGRHPNNSIRLADREVSKEHARIDRKGEEFLLRDLQSSNGTFVNGTRVSETVLKEGDELSLGNSRFVFTARAVGKMSSKVTVVASALAAPAVMAQVERFDEAEFRPGDQLSDVQVLRQDYEKLRIANEFHRRVGQERDPKQLLDRILEVTFRLVPADNAVTFIVGEDQQMIPSAVANRQETQDEVVVSDTVLQMVLSTRQAVMTKDAIVDSRFSTSESIVASGIRSAMAVPLMVKDKLKGILFCDTRERTHAFTEKDLKILSGLATQAASAIETAELARQIEEEAVTRAELSRFLSKAVADMVVQGKVELLRTPRSAEVSVLFADIRGFTRMAESEAPEETVAMLNSFFSRMATVVFRHEGNLDKFIGDCVMAVWGSPSAHEDDASRALLSALDMQKEVDRLNEERVAQGLRPIEVGIGVNTGIAVVGYMGSAERHEYTAIGDTVNVASRLCNLAKSGEIIAAESTVLKAGPKFQAESISMAQVKGKERGVATFRIVGFSGNA